MARDTMTRATSKKVAKGLRLILDAVACQELPDDENVTEPLNEILGVAPDSLDRSMEILEVWEKKGAPIAVTEAVVAGVPPMLIAVRNRGGSGTVATD